MPILELDSRIVRDSDLIAADMDGEVVMMSMQRGEYFGLNPVGSRIWELLESPIQIGDLCAQLEREFTIDTARCRAEVLTFTRELLEHGLIRQA